MEKNYLELKAERGIDGIVRYVERWSQMMEQEIKDGFILGKFDLFIADMNELIADLLLRCNIASAEQIERLWTKVQYGQAVNLLCNYWEHGEELRQWHNQKYHYSGEGVVNPAILTPPAKEDALPDMEPEEPGPAMSQ
jgi:hypothetical protein